MRRAKIVLVEAEDRRRHVLTLARASATAELVADWAEERHPVVSCEARPTPAGRSGVSLPSLRDFVAPRPASSA